MSLNEDKENTQSENKTDNKQWKAWEKNLLAGAICFTLGLTAPIAVAMNVKSHTNKSHQETVAKLKEENRSLKKQLEEQKEKIVEKIVTVPVYVTESIETAKTPAPTTDVPVTETKAAVSETVKEISEDDVKALTNPLTKTPPYKVKPPAPAQYTIYWIDVKRSDLASLSSDDFKFFVNYINEKYNTDDNVIFNIRLTDYPEIIIECPVGEFGKDTLFVCLSRYDDKDKCYRGSYTSCEMDISDPEKITLTGYKKDEYNLPLRDEDEVYSFPEFNEDLWSQLKTMHEHTKFLWS